MLVLSSFGSVAAWQPQNGDGETIGLLNGEIDSIPIEQFPNLPQYGFWMLTHEYPVPSNWVHDLADSGVECWSFLPTSAFHCELNGHSPSELAKLEVKGMSKMSPEAKLHPKVLPALEGETKQYMITEGIGILQLILSGNELPDGIESRGDVNVLHHSFLLQRSDVV